MNKQSNESKNITKKKSEMAAQSNYDYQKITYQQEHFVPCSIKESKEDLEMEFDTDAVFAIANIRNSAKESKLAALIDVAKLVKYGNDYTFSLNPENLYCDHCHRVYILERDVYKKGHTFDENNFLKEYKALIGYLMQKKYTYENYYNGGLELFRKTPFLAEIEKMETVDEIVAYLTGEHQKELSIIADKKTMVDKSKYRLMKVYGILATLLIIAALVLIGYWKFAILPVKNAVMASDVAYIAGDYVQLIDALQEVEAVEMDTYHQYTLALAYVKNENLSNEQRDNIISKLSINTDSRILRYWISIGRMDVTEAENIAMQCSDDELLLYAYLKEENLLEADSTLTGEEKSSRIDDLKKKIEDLSSKYVTEE